MADAAATIPAPDAEVPVAAAPIADLPSGEPIPSSAPPSKAPKRQPLPLGALLAALPSNADAVLTRLEKCLSTPSGIDTVMLFLCYTSKLGASVLSSLSQSALRRSAREWIALVGALPRGTTVVFSSPAAVTAAAGGKTALPATAALALGLSKRLSALSTLLSEARMILRLWALLGMYFWARRLVRATFSSSSTNQPNSEKNPSSAAAAAAPAKSKLATLLLEYARLALCITFQSLENGAYLSGRGVMSWTPAQQGRAYKWSARFWAAYVGIELGRLAAARFGPGAEFQAKPARDKGEWAKNAARQLAWAPLTLHWGSDKGLFGDATVGLLACIPGVIQMKDLWVSTA
ncbi:hypothetical protein N658DRAFT_490948 [Parathielavia hyrcaniae]|uniref:Peroxin 11C n=1 Tax=Parathielavia hyrcaniae TaxID=113614 RepID=A0AAN6T713_9PEZI|nr:hypothetical protein N658DRAFT_490948 [Parathielavia hyrcaniae]